MKRTLLLLLAGCFGSPDDLLVLSGTTLVDGVPLSVTRNPGRCDGGGVEIRSGYTSDGGAFSFDFVRGEIARAGDTTCIQVVALHTSGTRVVVDQHDEVMRGLMLEDWQPALSIGDDGGIAFSPLQRTDECEDTLGAHELVVGDTWRARDLTYAYDSGFEPSVDTRPLVLPPEAIEDDDGAAYIEATRLRCVRVATFLPGPTGFRIYEASWAPLDRLPVRSGGIPASRGASCPGPCAFTDGDASSVKLAPPQGDFVLELDRPRTIRVVVIRAGVARPFFDGGFDPPAHLSRVTVRTDGGSATFPLSERVTGRFFQRPVPLYERFEMPVPLGPAVRFEIRFDVPLEALGEISLFE